MQQSTLIYIFIFFALSVAYVIGLFFRKKRKEAEKKALQAINEKANRPTSGAGASKMKEGSSGASSVFDKK